MKAKIFISGQIMGNRTLLNAISCYDVKDGMFNSYHCYFDSIGDAKKAIREANKTIKQDLDADQSNCLSMAKDASFLRWDASTAQILKV